MSSRWRSSCASESGRASWALAVVALAAAVIVGCTALDALGPRPSQDGAAPAASRAPQRTAPPARTPFDHKFHLGKGIECVDCHEGADESDLAAMPKVEFCMECHEDLDAAKPKEKTVAAFLGADGKPAWSAVTKQAPDVVFSHKVHAAKKVECADCHGGIAESAAITGDLFVEMDACTKCHETKHAKNECATCHKAAQKSLADGKGPVFRPANHDDASWRARHGWTSSHPAAGVRAEECATCHDAQGLPESARCATCHASTRPDDHAGLWNVRHGQTVRRDPSVLDGRCATCHTRSTCDSCHATEPPRDHSQSWRVGAGHGLAAAMDRDRCQACHKADTCTSCHTTLAPRSHRSGWGSPRNRHCNGCHLPLTQDSSDGCAVCHRGTPSHQSAPPKPAWHRPDMQCRLCHERLSHTDNGTNCNVCHR